MAKNVMSHNLIIHEKSYKKKNLVSFIHKSRLRLIQKIFQKHVPIMEIIWADFGCSNGFIAEEVVKTNKFNFSKIVGYDHVESLLELARAKQIPRAEFKYFNMNKVNKVEERFNLVTCFETLEHVGDYRNAFTNLFNHLDKNGILIITVPNETGFIGLIKFFGRLVLRQNPYGEFFKEQSFIKYIKYLLKNDFIDIFRKPNQSGYGPHLGFDYRRLENYISDNFIKSKHLELIEKSFTGLKMNVIYVFKKI